MIQMISEQHLFMHTPFGCFLYKIDYELWQADVVFKIDRPIRQLWTIMDQFNSRSFLLYGSGGFVHINFIGDKLVVGPQKDFNFDRLTLPKLVGDKLTAFRYTDRRTDSDVEFVKFCEIDLITLIEESIEIPCVFDNNRPMPRYFVSVYSYF
jgi:hypothetical protein